MSQIIIRKATTEDSHDVWNWRNDFQTREMFVNADKVSWESHNNWFDKALISPKHFLYIGCVSKGEKVGICRFDIDKNATMAEVSINLNPSMRGKNLSHVLLAEAIKVFRLSESIPLKAKIKKQNIASIKCFTKCGFVFDSADDEYNYYLNQ